MNFNIRLLRMYIGEIGEKTRTWYLMDTINSLEEYHWFGWKHARTLRRFEDILAIAIVEKIPEEI